MREAGLITVFSPDKDRPILETPTLQCVHCGRHWQVRPGSGKTRGFCSNCNGPVCGPSCAKCVPQEQMLDNIESGLAAHFRPISGNVPGFF